ncbi:hypothetical protein TGRH88_040650 [Toxoplasma gondii]|uniref:Uncharacterized protein n=1 Tax=Toxoplasma gondii TaxID=5811 RepID=A0A7J6K056_TOXGO|nr:hypothetical protein TGRH88_040650 [Toxoplasma gondii]
MQYQSDSALSDVGRAMLSFRAFQVMPITKPTHFVPLIKGYRLQKSLCRDNIASACIWQPCIFARPISFRAHFPFAGGSPTSATAPLRAVWPRD